MRRPSALLALAQGALTIVVLAAGLYTLHREQMRRRMSEI